MPDDQDLGGWTAEPVDHDPFAVHDSSVTRNQPAFAGQSSGLPGSPPRPMPPPNRGLLKEMFPVDTPDQPQVYGGQWGQAVEHAYQNVAGATGSVVDWLGNKVEQGVGTTAAVVGVPNAAGLGRDIRGMIETGEGVRGVRRPEPVPRQVSPLGFYSHGADVAANLPQQRGTTQQLVAQLGKAGVKPAELKGAGLDDLSDMPPTTSKDELAWMLHKNLPPLQETVLGGPGLSTADRLARARQLAAGRGDDWDQLGPNGRQAYEDWAQSEAPAEHKYSQYTLPGGQNYREVLMHLPERDTVTTTPSQSPGGWGDTEGGNVGIERHGDTGADFRSSHWDQPNVVAHLRFNDRTGVPSDAAEGQLYRPGDAQKLLHMEELQSDWGQKGREQGFQDPEKLNAFPNYLADLKGRVKADMVKKGMELGEIPPERANVLANNFVEKLKPHELANYFDERNQLNDAFQTTKGEEGKLPAAPYVTSTPAWTDLGLKRALIEAANGGYSHLSWTPGEDQAARYSLEKHISDLSYSPHNGSLQARAVGGGRAIDERITPEQLPSYVGQETAQKLLAQPQGPHFSAPELHSDPNYAPQWAQNGWHTLSGQDLKVGGEGMKGYYDKMVPTQLSKLAKKLDPSAKIGTSQIQDWSKYKAGERPVAGLKILPSLEITPLMRERILKGLPQYQRGGRVGFADGGAPDTSMLEPVDHDPFPPAPAVQPSDVARAKGFPEPRSPMHGRIAAASQDEPAPGAEGRQIHVQPKAIPYTPEDIDQPGPMTETLAHYAGNPEHAMPMRIGAAIGEEGRRIGHGLWSAATLPGDIASGKTTMEDPETQKRAMDLAGAVTFGPAGGEVPEGALTAGMRRRAPRRPTGEMPEFTTSYEPPGWEAKAAELKPPPAPPAELSTADTARLSMIGHNKGPAIEQPLINQALPSFNDPNFPEGRIATSVPTSAARGAAAHNNNSLQIGMDLARENPETYRKNADVIRGYDWLRLPENATDEQAHEALINHAQNNLVAIYDAIHPDIRPTSSLWYDGANQIVNGMAHEFGRRPENISGLVAALSPQRDWFMNVENARRVADVLHHQADSPVSAAMEQWGRNYANSRNPNGRVTPDMVHADIDEMIGKPLSEMDADQKAFYVRMYDAAHGPHPSRVPVDAEGNQHPEGYYILNPDGSSTGRVARTNSGAVKRLTWGSGGQVANAIKAFEAEDMATISRAMGNRHKVRNFYNNNAAPNSASGATTIDTHAIAASLLQPLGASAPEVEHGLGMKGSKFNGNGSSGLYPNYFEAYKRAANQISSRPGSPTVLPRQLQSITWEGIRGLFNPQERSSSSFIEGIKNLWRAYKRGRMSLRNLLQRIMTDPATGQSRIRPPQWVTGDDRVEDEGGE